MLTRSRRALVAVVVGSLAVLLAGCGTGFNAQTSAIYQAGVGTNDRSGDVEVLNALFVINDDGSATLSAGLVNQALESDQLVDVSVVTGAGTAFDVTSDGPVALPIRRLYSLGVKPSVVVSGEDLWAGQFVTATFTFANAGQVELPMPVVSRTPIYAAVAEPEVTDPAAQAATDEGDELSSDDEANSTAEEAEGDATGDDSGQ